MNKPVFQKTSTTIEQITIHVDCIRDKSISLAAKGLLFVLLDLEKELEERESEGWDCDELLIKLDLDFNLLFSLLLELYNADYLTLGEYDNAPGEYYCEWPRDTTDELQQDMQEAIHQQSTRNAREAG